MRARRFSGLAVLVSAGLLASCATGGDGPENPPAEDATGEVTGEVSLQTWALKPKFTDYIEGVIAAFEDEHPGVDVTWLDQPGDGYDQKVLTQAASGDLPDVTNLPPDFALPLAEQGMLLDLETIDDTLEEDYVLGGLAGYQYPDMEGTYGYPWYLGTDVNYWNAKMMEENGLDPANLPTDLESLIEQARVMKEASGGDQFLMSRKPTLLDLQNADVPVFSEDGTECVFNTPAAAEVVQKYADAYAEGLLPRNILTGEFQGNASLFIEEKVAWTTAGGNFIPGVEETNPDLVEHIVPSPAFGRPPLYVQGLSVNKDSDTLPAAVALARFLTNAENQREFAKLVPGVFPSTTASADDPYFTESDGTNAGEAMAIAFESLENAMPQSAKITPAISTLIDQQIALALNGEASPQEALDAAAEGCTQLLNG